MTKTLLTAALSLLIVYPVWAQGRFSLGPDIGFTYQTHRTPDGDTLSGNPGFTFGLSGTYEFFSDLKNLALAYSVGYTLLPRFNYSDVTLGGVTGTYSENLDLFYWLVGARYHFLSRKWRPFTGLDFGFQFFNRRNVELRDQNGALRAKPAHSNHLNFTIVPQLGIEYRPTFRWAFGISIKVLMGIRRAGIIPAIQVPVSVHFAF